MSQDAKYLVGQGRVALVERDPVTGATGKVRYLGNAPAFKVSLKVDKLQHFESQTGKRQQDREIIKTLGAEVALTIDEITPENAEVLFYGTKQTNASATNVTEVLPLGIAAGETHLLAGQKLSNVVVTDSAGSPSTLVAGTDYVVDTDFGSITILNLGTYVQPFHVQYDRGATTSVPMFGRGLKDWYVRFEGLNVGNGAAQRMLVELYRVPLEPVADLDLIGEDFAKFELKGGALIDATRGIDPTLGQFGRIIYLD